MTFRKGEGLARILEESATRHFESWRSRGPNGELRPISRAFRRLASLVLGAASGAFSERRKRPGNS